MTTVLCLIIVVLLGGLVGVIIIWTRANKLLAKYDSIDDVDVFRQQCEKDTERLQSESKSLESSVGQQKLQLRKYMEVTGVVKSAAEAKQMLSDFNKELEAARRDIGL